jgi:hypothetical protein
MNTIGKNFPIKDKPVKATEESGPVGNRSSRAKTPSATVDSERVKGIGDRLTKANSIIFNTFVKNSREISRTIQIRDKLKELDKVLSSEGDAENREKIIRSFLSKQRGIENVDIENIPRTIDLYEKRLIRLKNVLQNIDAVAGYGKIDVEKLASDTVNALRQNNGSAESISMKIDAKNILKLLEG